MRTRTRTSYEFFNYSNGDFGVLKITKDENGDIIDIEEELYDKDSNLIKDDEE